MKKAIKRYGKDALSMTKSSIVIGVGASAVTAAGGNAGGLNAMAGMMPAMGSVAGGGAVLGMLSDLSMSKKRKRKK